MLNAGKFYAVYAHPDAARPEEAAIIVPQGFSLLAFLFHGLWALYYRAWALALVCLALFGAIAVLEQRHLFGVEALAMVEFGLRLWVGFEAQDWRVVALERRGYRLAKVVMARGKDEALLRFLDMQRQST